MTSWEREGRRTTPGAGAAGRGGEAQKEGPDVLSCRWHSRSCVCVGGGTTPAGEVREYVCVRVGPH